MRGGFTLIELIVAIVIAAIVGATLMMTLRKQERFYSSATEMMQLRSQLRDAADVLVADIRGAAVSRYGLTLMTDTALEFFATLGTSVLCATPSGRTLFLPPATLSSGAVLTSFVASPDTGDLALVLSFPNAKPDSAHWIESRISAFASLSLNPSWPATPGYPSPLDLAARRIGYA